MGGGFKTNDKDRRRWSRFPIERHVATIYTKKQFYRFSKEFEKHAEYDVNQESRSTSGWYLTTHMSMSMAGENIL
jgi:hypothetical protein